ncbi:MAG: hypothetical protein H0W83_01360 [Planctomycetes bacterium]|nr:hypothetical protein [Planctomycetota bacterium]
MRRRQGGSLLSLSAVLMSLSAVAVGETAVPSPERTSVTASSLLEQARHQCEAGRFEAAKALCQQARDLAPGDPAIQTELARISSLIPERRESPVPPAPLRERDILIQVALQEARMAADRAELLSASGRDEDAAAALEQPTASLKQLGPAVGPEVGVEIQRLEELSAAYRLKDRQSSDERQAAQRSGSVSAAHEEASRGESSRRSVFQERLARIEALRSHGHLEVALNESRRLVTDYPTEVEAEHLFDALLAAVHEQRRLSIDERRLELHKEVMARIEHSLIPSGSDGMPVFPPNFINSHAGLSGLEAIPAEPEWKIAIRDRMAKRVSFNFEGQGGVEALEALAREAGVNIVIDPQLLAGGERTVSIKASNMRLDHAFDWLVRLMDTHWSIAKGAIFIGGESETEAVLAVHDISAMTYQGQDQVGKLVAFNGGGNGSGGLSLFKNDEQEVKRITPEEVVDLLQKAVSPQTWKEPGYGISIRGTTLVVTAPASVHRLIVEFIRAQEHSQSIVIKVDSRWLEIRDGFLEEIGVNWGAVPLLITPYGGGFNTYSSNQYQANGRVVNNLPATAVSLPQAAVTQGLSLSTALLGRNELSALFTAIETNNRGRILSAPSVTTLNGVRANAFFGHQTAYIGDYEVVSTNLDPKIEVLTTGANLNVKPFVSADRKYVTMDFRPGISSAQFYTETLFSRRVITSVGNGSIVTLPQAYPLELPNLSVRETSTTVQVPDGGSMLVGGFGRAIDQTSAARIPFLGNIPFVGRLFGKRGRYSEHSQLYLLATVTIINYDELENTL